MRFEDFVLQFDTSSRGLRARVLKSPFGEGVVGFSLPTLAGGDHHAGPAGISRDIAHYGAAVASAARPPVEIGTELYRSIFQGQVRSLLDKSRGQLELSSNLGLRLKIKIDPSDEETGALADLPWELLCDGETEDFFALSRQTSLVRYLDVPRSSQPIPFTAPLRILAIGASPRDLPPLDLDEEIRHLENLNRSSAGVVAVEVLPHASAGAVRQALAGDTFNVLHFMGHGAFDRTSGEGMLAFEGSDGTVDLMSGKAFATKLRDLRSLGVVMLNACNTARAHQAGVNPFRGVATALVYGGVPAVVAMQRPISDRAAIAFSTAFYRHLAIGDSIDEALTEGRQAIHSAKPEEFEWATPVLFLRMPEGNVFVAKPAAKTEEAPPPAAPVAPPIVAPEPAPAPASRGPALKIAASVAGAGLVASVLYFTIPRSSTPPITNPQDVTTDTSALTTDKVIDPPPDPHTGASGTGTKINKNTLSGKSTVPDSRGSNPPPIAPQQKPQEQPQQQAIVTPSTTSPVPEKVPPPAPAPSADISSLSAT
ncbi:MAG TPA: CHAT domain-containing protein, partial [Thermoanaerobaculia bacterium]|nr:CHAT domain-containing protein [Thermoanaerobaculia bacterium]